VAQLVQNVEKDVVITSY